MEGPYTLDEKTEKTGKTEGVGQRGGIEGVFLVSLLFLLIFGCVCGRLTVVVTDLLYVSRVFVTASIELSVLPIPIIPVSFLVASQFSVDETGRIQFVSQQQIQILGSPTDSQNTYIWTEIGGKWTAPVGSAQTSMLIIPALGLAPNSYVCWVCDA